LKDDHGLGLRVPVASFHGCYSPYFSHFTLLALSLS
jgi:hypothetical protein